MKKTTLVKRFEKAVSDGKVNKGTKAYRLVYDHLMGVKTISKLFNGERVIRPCYTTGSRRHTKNCDHTEVCMQILDILKIKYTHGNDAPRGGLTGNYIKVITKITEG